MKSMKPRRAANGRVGADPSFRAPEAKRQSRFFEFFVRLVKEKPLGAFGGAITLLMLFTGVFADLLAPYGMNELHMAHTLEPPSAAFLLGTDNLGRDMLSRVIHGARISMIVGLGGAAVSVSIGTVVGMVSGYIGRTFDLILQRFVDTVMSLPLLPIMLTIADLAGPGMLTLILSLGVLTGVAGSRNMRGIILSYKENVYVQAAVAVGCPFRKVLTRHLLPNVMPFIITGYAVVLPGVIISEAALSFLGFGVPPPAPSWGGMLSGPGRDNMFLAPWMAIWPGLALSVAVYGISMFGDAVRDLLDPRLKGGVGSFRMMSDRRAATVRATQGE